jgi:pyridoxal phosphate enzyme (YggS family)
MFEKIIQNYLKIKNNISVLSSNTGLIVVSKNQTIESILKIVETGQVDFGENRAQEALQKWEEVIASNPNIRLHFIGPLQTNKVRSVFKLFHYIHSLDSERLAIKFSEEEKINQKKLKYFVQINLGEELQKSGIHPSKLTDFINFCKKLQLNIFGLMCIPPVNNDAKIYFSELKKLALKNNLQELSMGMSNDYKDAISLGSTWVRIGSEIFT